MNYDHPSRTPRISPAARPSTGRRPAVSADNDRPAGSSRPTRTSAPRSGASQPARTSSASRSGAPYPARTSSAPRSGATYPARSSAVSRSGAAQPARSSATARPTRASADPRRASGASSSRYASPAPASRRPAASNRRPAASARPQARKSASRGILGKIGAVFKAILYAILFVFFKIGELFKALNRQLDRFRRSEASTVVVNALLGGAALIVVLALIVGNFSALRLTYGRLLVSMGKYDSARTLAQTAEKADGPDARIDDLRLRIAANYVSRSEFDEALSILSLVPAGEEATRLTTQARFGKAEALFAAGSYADAAACYDQVSHLPEAEKRYKECLCSMAAQAYLDGNESRAQQLLLSIPDPETYIEPALLRVTGSAVTARDLMNSGFFSAQSLQHLQTAAAAVRQALSELPHGKIAAGDRHTVGLRADGTVVACGDNSYNQCSVTAWSNVTMLAAGARHTVGLRANGTVIACGDNTYGQLEVADWTDIVMIAASAYDTLGLKADGTVVACGLHAYDVSGWREISAISAGSYSAGCLSQQGAMRATHKSAQMSAGTLLASLSVCGTYSAGVGIDGSLVSSFAGAPQWSDLVSVTASSTGILAITNTGAVKMHFFRASDTPNVRIDGKVVEIASSGTHHVFLTSDGRVYAFGLNDAGQTGVTKWQLY